MVEKNKSRRCANSGGQPVVLNGTATTKASVPFTFQNDSVLSTNVYIKNTGSTNPLEVYLDGTLNKITLATGASFSMPMEVTEVELASTTTTYEIVFTF